eukprot:SAG22_NODE_5989_length_920_cov_1.272838_1_plen_195_part_10
MMREPLAGGGRSSGSDAGGGGAGGGAALGRTMTTPVTAQHREADVFAAAHNKVAARDLHGFNVNTGEFWKVWADAGGNVDSYIKDTLPTYGLIGALALSKQLSMTTDPPGDLESNSALLLIYAGLSHMASLMSFSMIIICMVVKTQYSCCICDKTRVQFACKFGFIVPMLFTIMIVMGGCWFSALLIDLYSLYDR